MKIGRTMRGAAALAIAAMALLAGCADKPEALVASAKELLAKNDRNAAVIQLRNALQKNPDLGEARFLLGKALLDAGDLAAAEKELRKASELQYPADQVVPSLARLLVSQGQARKAIDEFAKAEVTSQQSKAELQSTLGQAQLAMGDVDAARAAFAAAQTAVPGYAPALLGEARIKAATGDLPGALTLVETALAKSPALTEGWQFKGDIASAQGEADGALAAYRKALETRADHLPAHSSIVYILIRQGKNADAGKQLEAMTKVAPKHPETLYLRALLAFQEKNYTAAREAIQQQLRAAPDNLPGLALDGRIELQLGSYTQAETNLLKVLKRVPGDRSVRLTLVNLYLRSGRPAKALDALKPLLQEGTANSDLLAIAGEVYMRNGDVKEAERYFAKAAALDPKSSGKRTALALSRLAFGQGERELRELEDAAATDTGIRADLALIFANTGQRKFDAALTAIAALEKKQPDKPLPHNLRGAVLLAKGDRAGARQSFERAASLDPADFAAAANLARLDLADKKPDEAKKRFETVVARDPKNVQALLALAELRSRAKGTPEEVAVLIGKAVAADPTNPSPRLALVSHYLRSKEPKKAVAAAQDAVAALPDRPEILDAAGQAYRVAGEPNQAMTTYKKLAQLQPDSALPFMRMAELQIVAKENSAALENLRKALAIKPDLIEAQRAVIALDVGSGRINEALTAARDVQKRRPKESVGYVLEGNIHVYKKSWSDAATAYRAGLKQVGTTDLAIALHAVLAHSGKASEADSFAASWRKEHPKDRAFGLYLAQVAMVKKDYASAARQYKALLELQPDDALVLNNLAWVAGQLKDPKALEYAERADKLAPGSPLILDTLGMLLVEKGETARGLELLQKAVALAPNAAGLRLNLARALIKAGQKDAARKELDTLATLGDKFSAQAEVAKLMKEL